MQTIVSRVLCDQCLDLPVAKTSTPPHTGLSLVSNYTPITNGDAEAKFLCSTCETIWLHRKNKWGSCEGFRLNP